MGMRLLTAAAHPAVGQESSYAACPICGKTVPRALLDAHSNSCIDTRSSQSAASPAEGAGDDAPGERAPPAPHGASQRDNGGADALRRVPSRPPGTAATQQGAVDASSQAAGASHEGEGGATAAASPPAGNAFATMMQRQRQLAQVRLH